MQEGSALSPPINKDNSLLCTIVKAASRKRSQRQQLSHQGIQEYDSRRLRDSRGKPEVRPWKRMTQEKLRWKSAKSSPGSLQRRMLFSSLGAKGCVLCEQLAASRGREGAAEMWRCCSILTSRSAALLWTPLASLSLFARARLDKEAANR